MKGYVYFGATLIAMGMVMGGCACNKVKSAEPSKEELAKETGKLVGRWDWTAPIPSDQTYLRFREDGTFTLQQGPLAAAINGKFRVVQKGVMETDYPGLVWGKWVEEREYKFIDADTLEIFGFKMKRRK
jgi:hypothetical protein